MTMNTNIKLLEAGFTIIRRQEYPSICIKKCEYRNGMIVWTILEKGFESIAERERRIKELLKDHKTIDEPGEHNGYLESYEYVVQHKKSIPKLIIFETVPPIHTCEPYWEALLVIAAMVTKEKKSFVGVDECIVWAIDEIKKETFCKDCKEMLVQIYEKTVPPIHTCEPYWEALLVIAAMVTKEKKSFVGVDECIVWAIDEIKKETFCKDCKEMLVQIYEKTEQKTIPIEKEMKS